MSFYIRKSSGEKQRFDLLKFRRSILKAGATEQIADTIIASIKKSHPKNTQQIHKLTTQLLQQHNATAVADRYNLKKALMALGPEGYSFEKFIAQLFLYEKYEIETNIIVSGLCVSHEVDIIITKNNYFSIIECKFHNRSGLKSDVKVPLYVQARFEDISEVWKKKQSQSKKLHQVWLVTNTQFTTEAIKYAECKGIRLLGWSYPENNNLPQLIHKYNLFPITTLTSLSKYHKKLFLKNGLTLCKDAKEHKKTLKKLGFQSAEINALIAEAEAVCAL